MKEINAVALGGQAYPVVPGSGSTANTLKGKQSFESFLNVGNSAGTSGTKASAASVKQADVSSSANAGTAANKAQAADNVANQQTGTGNTGQEDMVSSTVQTGADIEASGVSETVNAVNNAVKEAVKDITGLDDETLGEIMSVLGMSFADLLDMGNLKQFIMYINNTSDVTDLLMDESIMSQLNNLADVIADIDIEAITGMPESDFAMLLKNLADGNMPVADNDSGSLLQEPGVQQETGDIPVIYVNEEDTAAVQKEIVQTAAVTKETANSPKELAGQKEDNIANENLQTGKETKESVNQTGQQEGLKQGTESQTGETLAESSTEAKPVHEETFSGQAGFIQNLAQAAADVQDTAVPQQARMQTMINIVNQVVEQIKVTMGREATSMQLQLNPESLGKVLISVTANHGVMTANFTVQSEEAKEALQSQMFSLREALESRNLKVDAVEVEVSDFAFSQSGQADAQNQKEFEKGNGRRFRSGFEDSEEEGIEAVVSGKQGAQKLDMGSSIDFTA